ncbi:hypothetical protein [Saccharopolyspora taberi]|uniref:Uncharacterized protein n=1 Tax=Saccharopolyspora taberi TaxID=60895 RepID=A0ABN3VMS6_9PSEU
MPQTPSPRPSTKPRVPVVMLLAAMLFVAVLMVLGHDPHLAVMAVLALLTGLRTVGR